MGGCYELAWVGLMPGSVELRIDPVKRLFRAHVRLGASALGVCQIRFRLYVSSLARQLCVTSGFSGICVIAVPRLNFKPLGVCAFMCLLRGAVPRGVHRGVATCALFGVEYQTQELQYHSGMNS
jgi:hypothetical protein